MRHQSDTDSSTVMGYHMPSTKTLIFIIIVLLAVCLALGYGYRQKAYTGGKAGLSGIAAYYEGGDEDDGVYFD